MKKLVYNILKYTWLMAGFFVLSNGIVLLVQARLGPAPWDVLHTGITNNTPLSLGQVIIGVGIILVTISWLLEVKPYTGTILNMIFIGIFVDLIINNGWYPVPGLLTYQVFYMVSGIILCGAGTGMYIKANLGSGPRDSLMLAICKKTGRRIGIVRTFIEVSVIIAGFLLGGFFGPGTILFSFTIGWSMELFLKLLSSAQEHPAFKTFKNSLAGTAETGKG